MAWGMNGRRLWVGMRQEMSGVVIARSSCSGNQCQRSCGRPHEPASSPPIQASAVLAPSIHDLFAELDAHNFNVEMGPVPEVA
jgi:hypothetical protein